MKSLFMASEVDQATQHLLEKHEKEQDVDQASRQLEQEKEQEREQEQLELQNEKEVFLNLKQQRKSSEILKSAVTIFTSNTKFMFVLILSVIPFFTFMVFTEIKLQKLIDFVPHFLQRSVNIIYLSESGDTYMHHQYYDENKTKGEFFSDLVQLCLFYLVLYPLFEVFSLIITIRMAAKAQAGDQKQATLKEVLNQNINNFTGLSITFLCVHLLSTLTVTGLFWIVANHCTITYKSGRFGYFYDPVEVSLYILSIVIHSAIFGALLYKYLEWSAFWNMAVVISVVEEQTGIGALGMADCYGKHCKRTGFQLMLVFFASGNALRPPCLFAGLCNETVSGVLVTSIDIGVFCLANLVKWVAFVLYFYDCKQQTLEKKADVEVGKS